MTLRFAATVILVAFAFVNPRTTHAQGAPVEDNDARTLFTLGQSAFDQGRYQAALDYFQQAYDLSHRPQLLYNIGQAADRLRDDRRALASFEQFLREVPDSPQHTSTRARVEVLRAAIAADDARDAESARIAAEAEAARAERGAAGPTVATTETPDAPPPRSGRSAAPGWIIAGVGGGALVAGATFFALGLGDKNTVEDAPDGSTFASVSDEYDRASTRITVGSILLGVGVAAGATGLVLALGAGGSDEEPTALELRVLPNGLALRRSF